MTLEVVVRSDVALEPSCSFRPEWSWDIRGISDGLDGLIIRGLTALGLNGYIPHARNPLRMFVEFTAVSHATARRPGNDHLLTEFRWFWPRKSEQALL